MGIISKAGLLITAGYKGFDKARGYFSQLTSAALKATNTLYQAGSGKDPLTQAAKPISKQQRDIESNIAKMSKTQRAADALGKTTASTLGWIKALAGIGAYFGIDKIVSGFSGWAHEMFETQKAAASLGMTMGLLMGFTFEMRQLGVDTAHTTKAMTTLFDLHNKARIGDVTADRLLARQPNLKKLDPKTLEDVSNGSGADYLFRNLQDEVNGLSSASGKAARLLMVLGDDAMNVANLFTKQSKLHTGAMEDGLRLHLGDNMNIKELDSYLDRMKNTVAIFDSALTQFKMAFMTIATEYLEIYARIINSMLAEAKKQGITPKMLAEKGIDFVSATLKSIANVGLTIAQGIESMVVILKNLYNKLPGEGNIDIGGTDLKEALMKINDKWGAKKFDVLEKDPLPLPDNMKQFQAIQEYGRMLLGKMVREKPLTDAAKNMIVSNKSLNEDVIQQMKELALVKDIPSFPKETYLRQFAGVLNKGEEALSQRSLQMPNANRMFSVDTESLVNKINMERDIKGRDPMERMIRVLEQSEQLDKKQIEVLEKIYDQRLQDIELLRWGK